MSSEVVRYGVIGCGVITPWHLRSLTEHVRGVKVVAVADVIPERAEAKAREFRVSKWYPSAEER